VKIKKDTDLLCIRL